MKAIASLQPFLRAAASLRSQPSLVAEMLLQRWGLLRCALVVLVLSLIGLLIFTGVSSLSRQQQAEQALSSAQTSRADAQQEVELETQSRTRDALAANQTTLQVPTSPAQRLALLNDALPPEAEREMQLKRLFKMARGAELVLAQVDYVRTEFPSVGMARLSLQIPVAGSYAAMRLFLDRALLQLPFLALDELSFQREAINSDEGEAILKLSLYFKTESAP